MKFLLVAIFAAFLCAAVVSAAPSSQEDSLETLGGDSWPERVKCVRDTLEDAVTDDLKVFWEAKKSQFQDIKAEWEKCFESNNSFELFRCRFRLARKMRILVQEIMVEFRKELSPKKIKEIREKIKTKCMKTPDVPDPDPDTPDVPDVPDMSNEFEDDSFITLAGDSWPERMKCVRDTLEDAVTDDLKAFWAAKKSEFQGIMTEWEKCIESNNAFDLFRCRFRLARKMRTLVQDIMTEFRKELSPKKFKEIREKIKARCMKKPDTPDIPPYTSDMSNEFEEYADASLPEQFQCIVDVMGDVSGKNGLTDLWSRTQPQLQMHLDQWKDCAKVENVWLRRLCNVKEGFQTIQMIQEYFKLVANENPKVLIEILRQTQSQCNADESFLQMLEL